MGQGAAGDWETQHGGMCTDRCRRLCGFVLCCVCLWCGVAWLACLPAGVGVVYESLWWGGMGWGVVGLRNGDCAGRHGGAPASTYVGEHRIHQTTVLLEVSFPFHLACKVPSYLLVLTSPRHGKGRCVMGIEEASLSMSVHPFESVVA